MAAMHALGAGITRCSDFAARYAASYLPVAQTYVGDSVQVTKAFNDANARQAAALQPLVSEVYSAIAGGGQLTPAYDRYLAALKRCRFSLELLGQSGALMLQGSPVTWSEALVQVGSVVCRDLCRIGDDGQLS